MVAIVTGNGLGVQTSSNKLGNVGRVGDATLGQAGEQVYVNATTGNLIIGHQDQLLIGRGINASINRAYNSRGELTGDHWTNTGNCSVGRLTGTINTAGSTVTLTDWDGSNVLYQYDATQKAYISTERLALSVDPVERGTHGVASVQDLDLRQKLIFDQASNLWSCSSYSGAVTETFDAAKGGRLIARRDADGDSVTYSYNAAGNLAQVGTANGDITYFDYDVSGKLTALRTVYRNAMDQLVTSTKVRYTYDAQGRLSQVSVDLTPDNNGGAMPIDDGSGPFQKAFTTTYTYDGTSSRIASIVESDGSKLSFTYQLVAGQYRVASFSETGDGGTVRTTTINYGSDASLIESGSAKQDTTLTDALGNRRIVEVTSNGSFWFDAGNSETQRVKYDDLGRISAISGNSNDYVRFSYNSDNMLSVQTDWDANIQRTYDSAHRLLTETVRDYVVPGQVVTTRTTRYAYDALGHLRFTVSSSGHVTEYRYNNYGQRTSTIEYSGSTYKVDSLGQQTAISESNLATWVGDSADRSAAIRTDATYDYQGNLASATRYATLLADGSGDASGDMSVTRYVYDAFGRLLQRFTGAPGREHVEQFAYDGLGRLQTSTSADGSFTIYQYDDAKHTVAVTFANGLTRTSVYDPAGELISVTESKATSTLSQVKTAYDAAGRLRMTTDADGRITHYLYNAQGKRTAEIGPDGTITEYMYNGDGSPGRIIRYATRLTSAQLATLVDANGRPVEKKGTAALTLDNSGLRPAKSTQDRTTWMYYYIFDRIPDHTVDGDGIVTQIDRDANGRPIKKTVYANRVDVNKQPSSVLPATDAANDRVTRYFYNDDGQLLAEQDPAGYLTQYRYDGAGNLVESTRYATLPGSSSQATGKMDQLVPISSAQDIHHRYIYDSRGLLCAEIDGEGYVTSYRYDGYGNLVERVQGQQIDQVALSAPQQVPLTVTARGPVGTVLEVWIDGVKAGQITLTSTSSTDYALSLANIVAVANHTLEFRSASSAGVVVQGGTFGTRAFASNALQSGTVTGDASKVAQRCALDMATTLLAFAATPGQIERTVYSYDAMSRVTGTTTYSSLGTSTTSVTYDNVGNRISEVTGSRVSTMRYDIQGRLTGQLTGEGSAALAALGARPSQAQIDAVWKSWGVTYTYDAAGQRTSMADANGNLTRYYYDAAGRLAYVINPLGETTEYLYDVFGDMTQSTVYATRVSAATLATLAGGMLTDALRQTFQALGSDGLASRTMLSYNTAGMLANRTDATGAKTDYVYNVFGDLMSKTADISAGVRSTTSWQYDRAGNQTRETDDTGGLNVIASAVYDAFGRVVQTTDANGVIRRNEYDRDGRLVVLTDGAGGKALIAYDAFGNTLSRTDRNGSKTQYAYSASNRQMTVTTAEGVATVTTYNEFGQTVAVKDGRGNTTSYTYDRDGNLVQTQSPLATTTEAFDHAGQLIETVDARGTRTTYSYDAAGRVLTRTVDPGGLALVTKYEYDAKGELVRTTDPSGTVTQTGYDLAGRSVSVIVDPSGLKLTTNFAYDSAGRVVTVTEGAGSTAPKVTQKTYDNLDRLLTSIVDPTGLKLTTRYTYDAAGHVVAVTDAAGGVTRYAYDAEGRQVWTVGPTGAAVQSAYDAEGRLVSQQRFANQITLSGLPLAATAAQIAAKVTTWPQRDEMTRYTYDSDGRMRFAVNAAGYVTEYVSDENGNVISSTAYATAVSLSGSVTTATVSTALKAQTSAMHAADRTTRTVYDAANRAVFVINAANRVTRNRYDANGNLYECGEYSGTWSASGVPAESVMTKWVSDNWTMEYRATTWFFDNANRKVYEYSVAGYTTAYRYDAAGRLLKTISYGSWYFGISRTMTTEQVRSQVPDDFPRFDRTFEQRYDSAGRLTDSVDPMGNVTHYELDALGRAVNTYRVYGKPDQVVTHAVFDAAGNQIEETRAYGTAVAVTTRYTYDAMGRVLTTVDPRGVELAEQDTAGALAQRRALNYVDSKGNALAAAALTQAQRNALLAQYTSTNTYDAAGYLVQSRDPLGNSVRYQYDAFGNKVVMTDPSGSFTTFFYDQLNRLVAQVSPNYSVVKTDYDVFGNITQVTHYARFKPGVTGSGWASSGWSTNLSSVLPATDAGDAITRFEYDIANRLLKTTDAEGFTETYKYDGWGNRTQYVNRLGATYSYSYNALGQVTREYTPVTYYDYGYDARGNVTSKRSTGGIEEDLTYTYDLLDRQISMASSRNVIYEKDGRIKNEAPVTKWTYDARGNLISLTDVNGNKTTWYYDAADHKTGGVGPTGTLTLYTSDAAGNTIVTQVYGDTVAAVAGTTPPKAVNTANVRETRQRFDASGHLIESRVVNVATGYFDPAVSLENPHGVYNLTDGTELVTTYQYDARGYMIASTDPSGHQTTYFYNSSGQKILQVDAMGYGIAWKLDAQGNVTQEIQFAQPYLDSFTSNQSLGVTLAANWPRSADDRITDFTWDRNGHKTSETREAVQYATVDAYGRMTQKTGNATTRYAYDGDGHVIQKIDANGSQYNYVYDSLGRKTSETLPEFTDNEGRRVRVTTLYEYNSLGYLTKETRQGDTDQVTTYSYDRNGRLSSTTSPSGTVTSFKLDFAGNIVGITRQRADADGRQLLDTITINYDANNREVYRSTSTADATTGAIVYAGKTVEQRYNAYGEITGRRTNGGGPGGAWQEYSDYNNAGWVLRTNFDDGVSHMFLYDKNGNTTLKFESMNTDLRAVTVATGKDIEALMQNVDMMQTYTVYDARNQVLEIRQPKVSGGVPYLSFRPVDIPIDGGTFANTQLSVGGWIDSSGRTVTGPTLAPADGDVEARASGDVTIGVTADAYFSFDRIDNGDGPRSLPPVGMLQGRASYVLRGATVSSLNISVSDMTAIYGHYDLFARVTYTGSGLAGGAGTYKPYSTTETTTSSTLPGGISLSVPINWTSPTRSFDGADGQTVDFSYKIEVFLVPDNRPGEPRLIGTQEYAVELIGPKSAGGVAGFGDRVSTNRLDSTGTVSGASSSVSFAREGGLPPYARATVYYRPAGSTQAFKTLPFLPNSYAADISSLADDDYEMIFLAVSDGSDGEPGKLFRRDGYKVHISHTDQPTVTPEDIPSNAPSSRAGFNVDASGNYIWSEPRKLNIYGARTHDERKLADHLIVHLRDPNNASWQVDYTAYRDSTTGAFALDMSSYGTGKYTLAIDMCDASGAIIDSVRGSVSLPGGNQSPELTLGYLADFKSSVVFHSQPPGTASVVVSWDQDGQTQYALVDSQSGDFIWDTTKYGIKPDTDYAINFTSYDASGVPLSMGQGTLRIGVNETSVVTLTGSSKPSIFRFTPTDTSGKPLTNVDSLTLMYRKSVQNDGDYDRPFTTVTLRDKDAQGRFVFDAGSLESNVEFEYRYWARDAAGTVLSERQSYFLTGTRNNPVTNVDIVGVIEELAKDMTIDRFQLHNAFGEVSAERDGRGNWTYSSYNTMGSLTLKQEPTVKVTLANGQQQEVAPLTYFYYDLTGNLVGLKDANGGLSTQQWNYGLATAAVAKSWDALGYSKSFQYDSLGNMRVSTDELNRRTDYSYDAENRLIEIDRPVLADGQRSIDRYEYDSAGNRIAHTDALGGRDRTYYDSDGRIVKTVSAAGRTVQYDYRWASTIASIGTAVSGGWIKTMTDANGRTMVDETDLFGRATKHTDLGGHVFRYTYNWAGLVTRQTGSTGQDVEYTYYGHGLVRSIVDNATRTQSLYEYDGDGNRISEFFTNFGDSYVFAQSRVEYDALNRVTSISDNNYQVSYEYDAVGNRRHMVASYTDMVGYHQQTQDYWYEYDALNRFTVTMGSLVDGHIVAVGKDAVQLGYDAAGQRRSATYAKDGHTELYYYDENGYLTKQVTNGIRMQERTNDLLGRVTHLYESDPYKKLLVTDVTREWDADGMLLSERDDLHKATTTYTRLADGTLMKIDTKPDDSKAVGSTSTYTYEWWDGAKQSTLKTQENLKDWKPATSYFNYDVNGNLKSTYDDGGNEPGNARGFQYWTDLRGQVQRRDELTGVTVKNGVITGATGDRKHNYYYLNGNRVGNQGNDGIDTIDYVQELAGKLGKGSENQFKVFTPVSTADFDENYMAINAQYPASAPGAWTVRTGDTLQSIASALWGDATLWYILADANGLQGADTLRSGQILTVPNKVTNIHNTATTFKPYDPGKAIGNTQPTLPDPPPPPGHGNGCGTFLQVIAIVVAVVVTVYTAGAAAEFLAPEATAGMGTFSAGMGALSGGLGAGTAGVAATASVVGGAAGAIASQGVQIAGGVQTGFNWAGVAMSAVGAGIGSGLAGAMGSTGAAGTAGSANWLKTTGSAVAQGAARSAMTQGLGMAVGAQRSFDWKGMAASAISSGVGSALGGTSLGKTPVLGAAASGLAGGVTSTMVRGGSLGRDMPGIAGDTIGAMVGAAIQQRNADAAKERTERAIGNMVVDNAQAASVGKTDTTAQRVQDAINGVSGQILPGELGGVGSGFVAPEYSSNAALFGVYDGLVDSSASSYSASSALFGPSMGLQDRQRPIMLADAGGNPDNTLLAWEYAKQAASDSVNFVKGLANTPIQFVNGAFELGHAAVGGLEAVGVFPPGAASGKTPQVPYFQAEDTFAARSGNAAGFALSMFAQIPEQIAAKGVGLLDVMLPGQAVRSTASDATALRRTYLNDKFDRTGNLNLDINIRGRQETATNFFVSQGVPETSIPSYMTGIDFTKSVEMQTIGTGRSLWQYQTPGAPQGNWYSFSQSVQPTELGISPLGFNRTTQTVEPKILNSYRTAEPVTMLRSTSAAVDDFWSVKGQSYSTVGGARQLFSTQKPAFVLVPR
jgi:YD repeat-containing protein